MLSIKTKIFAAIFVIIILFSSILFYLDFYIDKKNMQDFFLEKVKSISNSFNANLDNNILSNEDELLNLKNSFIYHHPEIVDLNLIMDIQNLPSTLNKGYTYNILEINKKKYLNYTSLIIISGQEKAALNILFDLDDISSRIFNELKIVISLYITFLILTFFILNYIYDLILLQPINKLLININEFSQGKSINQYESTNDELGILTKKFFELYKIIIESRKKIEQHEKELEKKVEEKTKELQTKIKELEKFQKIIINRELKMIELKKQIEELKKNEKEQK
ncbi:MAG: hypothetical protein QXE31_02030 [Candidatus Woesearchaeota archaeon]